MTEESTQATEANTEGSEENQTSQQEIAEKMFPKDEENSKVTEGDQDNSKGDGESKDANSDEKTEGDKDEVPETYKDLDFPEGVEVDNDLLSNFQKVAKDVKLSQGDAQKVLDLYTDAIKKNTEQQVSNWKEVVEGWANESKTDKEIGGDNFNENLGVAKKALERFGSKELNDALVSTGMGNHPEFIRFALKVGKSVAEDKFINGQGSGGQKTQAQTLFPNMK